MRRPSPSIVVSIIALVFATAGTSIAAVSFAKNAGAVDGKSATRAGSSTSRAAGKPVATSAGGALKGKLPARFLDLSGVVHGSKGTFAQGLAVADNSTTAPVAIGGFPGLGVITATCNDQNATAGKEDPQTRITFANGSNQTVNMERTLGNAAPEISTLAAATQDVFTVNNSNTFELYAQVGATHYVMHGVVRQDGRNTANAVCAVYGYAVAL
jgi:hypothetical protein